jgi:hypothetical protein
MREYGFVQADSSGKKKKGKREESVGVGGRSQGEVEVEGRRKRRGKGSCPLGRCFLARSPPRSKKAQAGLQRSLSLLPDETRTREFPETPERESESVPRRGGDGRDKERRRDHRFFSPIDRWSDDGDNEEEDRRLLRPLPLPLAPIQSRTERRDRVLSLPFLVVVKYLPSDMAK